MAAITPIHNNSRQSIPIQAHHSDFQPTRGNLAFFSDIEEAYVHIELSLFSECLSGNYYTPFQNSNNSVESWPPIRAQNSENMGGHEVAQYPHDSLQWSCNHQLN